MMFVLFTFAVIMFVLFLAGNFGVVETSRPAKGEGRGSLSRIAVRRDSQPFARFECGQWTLPRGFSYRDMANVVWHGCSLSVLENGDGREFTLLPGRGACYGFGLYGSSTLATAYTDKGLVIGIVNPPSSFFRSVRERSAWVGEPSWVVARDRGLVLRLVAKSQLSDLSDLYRGIPIVLAEVVRGVKGIPATALLSQGTVSVDRLREIEEEEAISSTPTMASRFLGLALGVIFSLVPSPRWQSLGRFLLRRGGLVEVDQKLVNKAMANLNPVSKRISIHRMGEFTKQGWFIRPEASEELFWMVGGMTLIWKEAEKAWVGKDVYDFHPQRGQGVVVQGTTHLVWSFSQLPSPYLSPLVGLASKFIPGSLLRTRGRNDAVHGKLQGIAQQLPPNIRQRADRAVQKLEKSPLLQKWEISNNFWNWLGGRPFTTVVRYTEPPPKRG